MLAKSSCPTAGWVVPLPLQSGILKARQHEERALHNWRCDTRSLVEQAEGEMRALTGEVEGLVKRARKVGTIAMLRFERFERAPRLAAGKCEVLP